MTTRVTRRQFLAATLAVAGCQQRNSESSATLRIFVYAGGHEKTMREEFVPRFEAATGARVLLDGGWWDAIAKLKSSPAGQPAYDLLITDATQGYPAARDGLFADIDPELIPNHRLLAPSVLDNWIFRDRHGLPYPDSVMSLAYETAEANPAPTNWGDLLRPAWRGKIGLYNAHYMSLYTFACMWAAIEGKPGTARERIATQMDEVLRFAKTHRDQVRLWWPTSTDMLQALRQGEVIAGNMHSPELLQALIQDQPFSAVVPEEDRAFVQVFWAIAAGSPKRELAHRAIDMLFSPELQLAFARQGSATAILSVAEQMALENPRWASLYPHTAAQFATLDYYPYDDYVKHAAAIEQIWNREVLRGG